MKKVVAEIMEEYIFENKEDEKNFFMGIQKMTMDASLKRLELLRSGKINDWIDGCYWEVEYGNIINGIFFPESYGPRKFGGQEKKKDKSLSAWLKSGAKLLRSQNADRAVLRGKNNEVLLEIIK